LKYKHFGIVTLTIMLISLVFKEKHFFIYPLIL